MLMIETDTPWPIGLSVSSVPFGLITKDIYKFRRDNLVKKNTDFLFFQTKKENKKIVEMEKYLSLSLFVSKKIFLRKKKL